MAEDTIGLMDVLGIKSAHLVGASMGGMIAQEIAISFPQRVRSLTSIMSTTGNPRMPPPTREAAAMLMAPPPTTKEEYLARFAQTWKMLRVGSFPEDEALDRARAERTFERGLNPAGVGRQLRAILASGSRKERLHTVKAPTLVIHGTVDPLVRPSGGKDTAASIPGAKLLMIEGMGHALPIPMWPRDHRRDRQARPCGAARRALATQRRRRMKLKADAIRQCAHGRERPMMSACHYRECHLATVPTVRADAVDGFATPGTPEFTHDLEGAHVELLRRMRHASVSTADAVVLKSARSTIPAFGARSASNHRQAAAISSEGMPTFERCRAIASLPPPTSST